MITYQPRIANVIKCRKDNSKSIDSLDDLADAEDEFTRRVR